MSIGDWTKEDSSLATRKRSQTFDLINTAFCGTSTNVSNAYTLTFPLDFPNLARLLNGETFRWIPSASNTGAATLVVPGIAAASIKRYDGTTALSANDIISGSPVETAYDTANSVFRLTKPSIGGNLQAAILDATTVNATTGTITTINSTTGNITTVAATTVGATTGNITTVNATTLDAATGNIDDVNATTVDATTVTATTGTFTNITSAWTTWTPTVTDTGAGAFTATDTYYRYRVIGKKVEFLIRCLGTSTASITTVELTLPAGITPQAVNHYNAILINVGGGTELGKVLINNTTISIQRYDGSAWSTATSGMFLQFVSAELA